MIALSVLALGLLLAPLDPQGQALIKTFSHVGHAWRAPEKSGLGVLDRFVGAKRPLLLRHLAASAKWFVTEERGKTVAIRRFAAPGGRWISSLNGFYTPHTFDQWDANPYQCRIVIGLDGTVFTGPWREMLTETTSADGPYDIRIESRSQHQSYVVVRSQGPALEIFEQSPQLERRFTQLALDQIRSELHALWNSETAQQKGFDPALLTAGSIQAGQPEMTLIPGFQGGLYEVSARINPQEAGRVHLKVFDAKDNTRLSEERLTPRSLEYVGWSPNPQELFFYNTDITVYEGDWGDFYPARFELWFQPASGKPQRKLIEKVFKIEGWQR